MPETQAQTVKINVYIYYTESPDSPIKFDFYPGNPYFDYGLYKQISTERWKQIKEGDIWLGCEVTEEEAKYIERIAYAVWGKDGYEVIGRPKMELEELEPWRKKETDKNQLVKKPNKVIDTVMPIEAIKPVEPEVGQLSLF
jgi:hypothetical protein